MRIRISTALPLPPLKAWYLVPSSVETIQDLKTQLVLDIPAFKGVKPASLAFEVDGFEVLAASRCEVLNEERDVLCVKLQENPAPLSKKRKKARSEAPPPTTTLDSSSSSRKKRKLSPAPAPTPPSKKSKSLPPPPSVSAPKPPKKKKVKTVPPPPPPPAPAPVAPPPPPPKVPAPQRPAPSDSSDSNSDSDSDSESSSSSSSSDSDSSSSSSDSSSGPETSSSKLIPAGRPLLLPKSFTDKGKGKEANSTVIHLTPVIPDQPPVPPGQGLSSTHERNVRRRKKKAALKLLASTTNPSSSSVTLSSSNSPPKSTTNSTMPPPASPSPFLSSQTVDASQSDVLIPFSASANRNKKRDFKKAMATAVGQKTTFFNSNPNVPIYSAVPPPPATPSRVSALQGNSNSNSATSTPTGGGKRPYQHVLAPSERTSLPAGMFVTSVDVETEEWEAGQGWGVEVQLEVVSKKKGGKGGNGGQENGGNAGGRKGREENGADGSKEWSDYIRSEEENTSAAEKGQVVSKQVDWSTVDASFEGASPVTSFEQLKVGSRVGWKELILDPSTFTPAISLLVGTVATIEGVENVSVKMEKRPLEVEDEEMYDDQEEMQSTNLPEQEEDEIRVFGKDQVVGGDWRLL